MTKKLSMASAQSAVGAIMRIERMIEANEVVLDGPVMIALAINKNVLIPAVQAYEAQRAAGEARVMGQSTPRDPDFIAKQAALVKSAIALQNVTAEFQTKEITIKELNLDKNSRLGSCLAALACLIKDEKELQAPDLVDIDADEVIKTSSEERAQLQ